MLDPVSHTVDTFNRHLKTRLFSLNMMPPAPLTLWHYTNAVIIIIMVFYVI